MRAPKKIALPEFANYLADAIKRWVIEYERATLSQPEYFPSTQHFGAWLRAFLGFVREDRIEMAKRDDD